MVGCQQRHATHIFCFTGTRVSRWLAAPAFGADLNGMGLRVPADLTVVADARRCPAGIQKSGGVPLASTGSSERRNARCGVEGAPSKNWRIDSNSIVTA